MSIMDSGVVYHVLTPPEELPNPVEGQPLSVALKYILDHTGFTGDLMKVLQYCVQICNAMEAEIGQVATMPKQSPQPTEARHFPQAPRSTTNPHGLNLPRGVAPFSNGMTTSSSLYRKPGDSLPEVREKQTLPANPDPRIDPLVPVIEVPSGGNATDPALAAEIEIENKVPPSERFKLGPLNPGGQLIIVPESDDLF